MITRAVKPVEHTIEHDPDRKWLVQMGLIQVNSDGPLYPGQRPYMHKDAAARTRAHYIRHGIIKPRSYAFQK